jgi:hypothetical protein
MLFLLLADGPAGQRLVRNGRFFFLARNGAICAAWFYLGPATILKHSLPAAANQRLPSACCHSADLQAGWVRPVLSQARTPWPRSDRSSTATGESPEKAGTAPSLAGQLMVPSQIPHKRLTAKLILTFLGL